MSLLVGKQLSSSLSDCEEKIEATTRGLEVYREYPGYDKDSTEYHQSNGAAGDLNVISEQLYEDIKDKETWLNDRLTRLQLEEIVWNGGYVAPEAEVIGTREQENDVIFMGQQAQTYSPTGTPIASTLQFPGGIPEQVFVEGYADTEDMNPFILDSANLFPAGAMPWDISAHPSGVTVHKTTNNFTPTQTVDINGVLPTGVTWNKATGKLSYDGSAIVSNEVKAVTFQSGQTVSPSFNIKVLKATEVFDYDTDGLTLHEVVTNAFAGSPTGEIVILVKQGTWTLSDHIANPGTTYFKGFADYDNYYLIGEPDVSGLPPVLSGDRAAGWADVHDGQDFENQLTIISKRIRHVHIKNIRLRHGRFSESNNDSRQYMCFNRFMLDTLGNGSGDGLSAQKPNLSSNDSYLFLSNIETFWVGSNQTKHPFYLHHYNQPAWGATDDLGTAYTFVSNYKAWETHSPGQATGGHAFKDLSLNSEIRHFWISRFRNPTVDTSTPYGYKLMSMHTHRKFTINNGVLWDIEVYNGGTQDASLLVQNRGISAEHFSDPPYFDLDEALSTDDNVDPQMYPYWENASGLNTLGDTVVTKKNPSYHGSNVAPYNYSVTGAYADTTPNATAPTDAPFWDTVGDITDINNTHVKRKHKFISNVEFNNVLTGAAHLHAAVKYAWDAPENPDQKFGAQYNYCLLPVPPNWKPLTHLFMCNNTFNNFNSRTNQTATLYFDRDASGPNGIVYPYSPNSITGDAVMTDLGGNIVDGSGYQISIPEGFKI